MSAGTERSSLRWADVLRLGAAGLLARPTRAALSALGIAIGIAAMLAVVGISTSSQAQLTRKLDALGTNLLAASPGEDLFGRGLELPSTAAISAGAVRGVSGAATTGDTETAAYRNTRVPEGNTNGIVTRTASLGLPDVVGARMRAGTWLTEGTSRFAVTVLGARTAELLGVDAPGQQVVIGGTEFVVAGILAPVELVPELDISALIGEPIAAEVLGDPVPPTTVYVRADEGHVDTVREVLPASIHPQEPDGVEVSRPSDALAAKQAADQAFTGLLVGLGSVALLVGGIGVANTMVISVLERRREIGLRRALGATRSHIRRQFLAEALFLSLLGGVVGVLLGVAVTGLFAALNEWPLVVAPTVVGAGLGATLLIGALAGLYPAMRAARIPPTEALQS